MKAKPFVKWAGGKGQLLGELEKRLPLDILQEKTIARYAEPFLGGGALFFFMKNRYKIQESYLADNNKDLMLAYKVIKNNYNELVTELTAIEECHLQKSEEGRRENFYLIRDIYNSQTINYQQPSSE